MTKREAYLSFKCWHCVYLENESGECLCGDCDNCVFGIVIKALEKQTTKYKHINTRYTHWGKCRHDKFRCETCGFTKEFTNNHTARYLHIQRHTAQYQYCPSCGREINWSKPKGSDCDFMFIDEVIAYDTQKED